MFPPGGRPAERGPPWSPFPLWNVQSLCPNYCLGRQGKRGFPCLTTHPFLKGRVFPAYDPPVPEGKPRDNKWVNGPQTAWVSRLVHPSTHSPIYHGYCSGFVKGWEVRVPIVTSRGRAGPRCEPREARGAWRTRSRVRERQATMRGDADRPSPRDADGLRRRAAPPSVLLLGVVLRLRRRRRASAEPARRTQRGSREVTTGTLSQAAAASWRRSVTPAPARGRVTVILVPTPSVLSSSMAPPCSST